MRLVIANWGVCHVKRHASIAHKVRSLPQGKRFLAPSLSRVWISCRQSSVPPAGLPVAESLTVEFPLITRGPPAL